MSNKIQKNQKIFMGLQQNNILIKFQFYAFNNVLI